MTYVYFSGNPIILLLYTVHTLFLSMSFQEITSGRVHAVIMKDTPLQLGLYAVYLPQDQKVVLIPNV